MADNVLKGKKRGDLRMAESQGKSFWRYAIVLSA